MKRQQKLDLIRQTKKRQLMLAQLVENGFRKEATELVQEALCTDTAFLYYDWHSISHCYPLANWTGNNGSDGVFVVIRNGSTKLDLDDRDDSQLCFELGWEQDELGWVDRMSDHMIKRICANMLGRPLSNWNLRQAEGTDRAARARLPSNSSIRADISALRLVFHLRQANFGKVHYRLSSIPGFTTARNDWEQGYGELVEWMVQQILSFGWSEAQVRKELVEWIRQHPDTCSAFLLAVVHASVFGNHDLALNLAVQNWLLRDIEGMVRSIGIRSNKQENKEYANLFGYTVDHHIVAKRVHDALTRIVATGDSDDVDYFVRNLGTACGLCRNAEEATAAIVNVATAGANLACSNGDYDTALKVMEKYKLTLPNQEDIRECASILGSA